MSMSFAFLERTRMRKLGAASLLSLLFVGVVAAPGCLDEGGVAQPTCTEGQSVDTSATDCKQSICANGVMVEQADDTEIPDDSNPCTLDSCVEGAPSHASKADGESCMLSDKVGTCAAGVCEVSCTVADDCNDANPCTSDSCGANMKCAFAADNAAIPDDLNPCTNDSCKDSKAVHENAPAGTSCGPNATCDGLGICTGCTMDSQCPADTPCADNFCDAASGTCKSMALADGPLPDMQVGDCKASACLAGDLVAVMDDTDVPMSNNECVADSCNAGMPESAPKPELSMCAGGVCDGNGACVECISTSQCMLDYTCSLNQCFSCNDTVKNGNETDVDCGGECIARCATGSACIVTADCDGECDNGVCVDCFDGAKNGTEGDIDCGGVCDQKCNTNQSCTVGMDCASGVCTGNKCAAPSCMDGIKNGSESDVDCGGSCMKCEQGKMCTKNGDCQSNSCDTATKTCN